jgi:hypothetical protein
MLDSVSLTTGPFGSGDCLVRTVLLSKTHPHVHFTSFASIVIWCIVRWKHPTTGGDPQQAFLWAFVIVEFVLECVIAVPVNLLSF